VVGARPLVRRRRNAVARTNRVGIVTLALVASLAACGGGMREGGGANQLAPDDIASDKVPPATDDALPRWEYLCLSNPSRALLADAGLQGWEMVAISKGPRKAARFGTSVLVCFKRPLIWPTVPGSDGGA
jgi:hypothetical protein